MIVTNETWQQFAKNIATEGDPLLHSPAAMERYIKFMSPYITNVRTPHGKFRSINVCEGVEFKSEMGRKRYGLAEQKYFEDMAKLGREVTSDSRMMQLVIFNKYRQAAELEKADNFAELAHESVVKGNAAVIACCFRGTIARTVRLLVDKYGYNRNKISLIWGGDDTLDKSKRLTPQEIRKYIGDMTKGIMPSTRIMKILERQLTEDAEQKAEAEKDYSSDLKLGGQSREQRQEEIDRFQSGKSHICLFTFSSGGTGLSLHHTEKNSYGQDVTLRPRIAFLSPTYSAQDFVQGLGRAHRSVFSMSDTYQYILFFKGTIEMHVMKRVSLKLRCLKKVVQQRESWADAIYEGGTIDEKTREAQLEKEASGIVDDTEPVDLNETESEDEE